MIKTLHYIELYTLYSHVAHVPFLSSSMAISILCLFICLRFTLLLKLQNSFTLIVPLLFLIFEHWIESYIIFHSSQPFSQVELDPKERKVLFYFNQSRLFTCLNCMYLNFKTFKWNYLYKIKGAWNREYTGIWTELQRKGFLSILCRWRKLSEKDNIIFYMGGRVNHTNLFGIFQRFNILFLF